MSTTGKSFSHPLPTEDTLLNIGDWGAVVEKQERQDALKREDVKISSNICTDRNMTQLDDCGNNKKITTSLANCDFDNYITELEACDADKDANPKKECTNMTSTKKCNYLTAQVHFPIPQQPGKSPFQNENLVKNPQQPSTSQTSASFQLPSPFQSPVSLQLQNPPVFQSASPYQQSSKPITLQLSIEQQQQYTLPVKRFTKTTGILAVSYNKNKSPTQFCVMTATAYITEKVTIENWIFLVSLAVSQLNITHLKVLGKYTMSGIKGHLFPYSLSEEHEWYLKLPCRDCEDKNCCIMKAYLALKCYQRRWFDAFPSHVTSVDSDDIEQQ